MHLLESVILVELVIDIILAIDIVMNFFTSYTKDVTPVTDLKKISFNYLTTNFIFDFLGIVPGLVTLNSIKLLYPLKLLRFIELHKFFDQIRYILEKLGKVLTFINKRTVQNILVISKSLFALLFLIHVMACLWILIGRQSHKGWLKNNDEFKGDFNYLEAYPAALYYITTTFTTIGYGDYLPNSDPEIILVMILELIGLASFSYILGTFKSIESQKSVHYIIQKKQEGIEHFLTNLSEARKDCNIPLEVYEDSIETIGATYKYNISYLFNMFNFLEQIKPQERKELVFDTMKLIYIEFKNFFWNEQLGFQADDRFIIQFLTKLESQLFFSGKILLERGEQ